MDLTAVSQSCPGQLSPTSISIPDFGPKDGDEAMYTRFELNLARVTFNVYAHGTKSHRLTLLCSVCKLPAKFINSPATLLTLLNLLNEGNVVMSSYLDLTDMSLVMVGAVPDDVKGDSLKMLVTTYLNEVGSSMDCINVANDAVGDGGGDIVFMTLNVHGNMKEAVDRLLGESAFEEVAKLIDFSEARGSIQ